MPFFAPYASEFLDTRQQRLLDEALIRNRIVTFREVRNITDQLKRDLLIASSTTVLGDEQAISVMKSMMGYQSIYHVEWLRDFVAIRNNKILDTRRNRQVIRLALFRQGLAYVGSLNDFSHNKLGRLGAFVSSKFPMDTFLDGIYAITFSTELTEAEKSAATLHLMLSMEGDLWVIAADEMQCN